MFDKISLPERALGFPELRYMGSKHRLLPWIHGVLRSLDFETAADPFAGSGSVAYLLKSMGKQVFASDFLNFPAVLASATVANSQHRIDANALKGRHLVGSSMQRVTCNFSIGCRRILTIWPVRSSGLWPKRL